MRCLHLIKKNNLKLQIIIVFWRFQARRGVKLQHKGINQNRTPMYLQGNLNSKLFFLIWIKPKFLILKKDEAMKNPDAFVFPWSKGWSKNEVKYLRELENWYKMSKDFLFSRWNAFFRGHLKTLLHLSSCLLYFFVHSWWCFCYWNTKKQFAAVLKLLFVVDVVYVVFGLPLLLFMAILN